MIKKSISIILGVLLLSASQASAGFFDFLKKPNKTENVAADTLEAESKPVIKSSVEVKDEMVSEVMEEKPEMVSEKNSSASQEAIMEAQKLGDQDSQITYLIGIAKSLIQTEAFKEAINIAQYIINNLDPTNLEARQIIELAKSGLKQSAQNAITDFTGKIGF